VSRPADGRHPTVSVVSVNYNGSRYLERFLRSVLALEYPASSLHVVLVDNASTDGSVELVRRQFPSVHVVEAGGNIGFAAGCNLGMSAVTSDYVVLVNNDTVVEPRWLQALVDVAESDARIGLVGSKLLFLTPFLDVGLETRASGTGAALPPSAPAVVLDDARVLGCDYDKLIVRAGRLAVGDAGGRLAHTLAPSARVAVPLVRADAPATLELTLRAAPGRPGLTVGIVAGDVEIERVAVTDAARTVRVEIPRDTVTRIARDLINNAGTHVDAEGRFGDRGIFEFDHGQYDAVADVPALCGASMLLRRAMLEHVGGFDARYFMYFEDVDLSWRARRAGWRVVYTPHSRLRHVHAGSSREGSPLWIFFVARNHMFWLIKNGTARAALRALGTFCARATAGALRAGGHRALRRPAAPAATREQIDLQIARSLARHFPGLVVSRYRTAEGRGAGKGPSASG
jgi:GT2 family glycosyltransferase